MKISKIKTVTAYKTTDGTVHENGSSASQFQKEIDFKKHLLAFIENLGVYSSDEDILQETISSSGEELFEVLKFKYEGEEVNSELRGALEDLIKQIDALNSPILGSLSLVLAYKALEASKPSPATKD